MMNINYEEELLKILESNTLRTLPSKAVIDSSERVVKAIWKNFTIELEKHESFSFERWYKEAGWGVLLQKYADNIPLWEELFESRFHRTYWASKDSSYDFILSETFRGDFPIVADHFLGSNDKLIELFNKTHNQEFFKRLTLDQNKKEDIYKIFLIDQSYHIDKELIQKYENDDEFVKRLLNKSPTYFRDLNEETRNKNKYINIALRDFNNYYILSNEKKEIYFKPWANNYINHLKLKNLESLTTEQQAYILSKRENLLTAALNSNKKNYHSIATSCLLNNVEEYINAFDEEKLKIFAKNSENIEKIRPQLEKFIENYSDVGLSKKDNKILFLVRYIPELKDKIQENIFYKINQLFEAKEKLDSSWFEHVSKQIIDLYDNGKIDKDKAEGITNKARSCLTIDALKELRIPKQNTFNYIKSVTLNKKLEENLPVGEQKNKKMKI